uniref:NADH dehydrogenase subunit 6 n=1 Tax=Silvatares holzenthali TaxID=3026466 RepID=UPI0023D7D01B|nr:NADH dehydrogenase subunit 6 [Silvatares holzenthali]WCR50266.1 NADH dehydrogenase subunit 6 [Silvatares holzenthali]
MNFFLLFMMIFSSLIMLNLSHPLLITMILIMQILFISLLLGMLSYSFWMTYLTILAFIGGLLILFIYMASLTPNKINLINLKLTFKLMLITMIIFFFIYLNLLFFNLEMSNLNNSFQFFMNIENNIYFMNFYNMNEKFLTILLMNYLMFTLLVTSKIATFSQGPMRIKF